MSRRLGVTAAIAMSIALLGCGALENDLPPTTDGAVDVTFLNTSHLHLSALDYAVSGNGIEPIMGTIPLTDDRASPSALIGGLPAGPGYLLQLSAMSDDGTGFCYGQANFDVLSGELSPVDITLVCNTGTNVRTTIVNGYTDYCPALASYGASPPAAPIGGTITLSATAFSYYTDPLMFGWRTTTGTLSSENTAVSTYTCTMPGVHTLVVFVTDGNCPDIATLDVTCFETADAGAEVEASL